MNKLPYQSSCDTEALCNEFEKTLVFTSETKGAKQQETAAFLQRIFREITSNNIITIEKLRETGDIPSSTDAIEL